MVRSALLTFRMHRFEVLLASLLMALTSISAMVAYSHVTAANPPDQCWKENWSFSDETYQQGTSRTPGCAAKVNAFWGVATEAGTVASPIAVVLPFVVGLLLGVPIVGRELELRTAAFAWSLSGDRLRWLLSRLLPMLALAMVGLLIAATLVAVMAKAAHPWNYLGPGRIPDLTELGSEGPTLVGRGLLAFGLGALLGAVLGRTMPAFAIAAVVSFVLMFFGAPALQAVIAGSVAEWRPQDQESDSPTLGYFGTRFRDADGTLLTYDQAQELMRRECPRCPPDEDGWIYENLTPMIRVAPISAYPVFEAVETGITSAAGIACILLTFPVVSRRRPG